MKRNPASQFFRRAATGCAIFSLLFAQSARAQFTPTASGAYDYNNIFNWLSNLLTSTATFSQTPAGPQTITFALAPLLAPTLNFTMGGTNKSLSLLGTGLPVTLTLGGDITVNSPGALVTIGDSNLSIALGGSDRTFSIASGNTLTLAGVVSGSNGFTVTSGGTLVLTGANTYSGATTINASAVKVSADNNLGAAPGSATAGQLALNGGTLKTTASFTLNANRGVSLGSTGGTFDVGLGTTLSYGGILAGTAGGTLTVLGGGTLSLTGISTYDGLTNIMSGATLAIATAGALPSTTKVSIASGSALSVALNQTLAGISGTGTADIASGATLTLNTATTGLFNGTISGSGSLVKTGGDILILGGANTFTGGTTISAGQLTLKNATGSATGTGNVTVGSSGTLQIGDTTAAGSLSGNIANAGFVIFNRPDSFSYAGVISGAGILKKYGAGTLTLTSDQNYTGATTIYAGTLAFGNGGTSGGVASDIAVSSGATLAINRSDTIGYTNIVSGAGNFVKDGTGTLILGGANTFTGTATVSAGTLTVGVANALPAVAASVASGATLDVASNLTLSTLSTAGTTAVASGKTLTISGGSLTGVVSGAGGLTKTGANTLTLTSNQTYTGTTTVSAGYLVIGNQTASGNVAGNIVNNATLTFARSDDYTYNGYISGSGVFFQSGGTGSILTLTGVNTYGGTTNITSGTLKIGAVNTLPSATTVSLQSGGILDVSFNQTVGSINGPSDSSIVLGSGAKLTLAGSSGTAFDGVISGVGGLALAGIGPLTLTAANLFSGGITLGSGSGLSVSSDSNLGAAPGSATAGQLTFDGGYLQATASFALDANRGIELGSGGGSIYVDTGFSLSYGGIIAGTGGLTKYSPGTLTLSGASTYSGPTVVTGGKLLVTNSTGSATGTGSVTVNNGAIFGGSGTISGALILTSGGIVSPGATLGTLNVGATTLAGGAKFDFKINDATGAVGTNWNLLNISGGLTLNTTSVNPFVINLSSLTLGNIAGTAANFDSSLSYNWQFVTASGGITGFDADAFQFNTSLFQNSLGTGNFYVSQSGNSLLLNFTPVPEPSTWALLALGLVPVALALRRRSGRHRDAGLPSRIK